MPARGQNQRISRLQKTVVFVLEEIQLKHLRFAARNGTEYDGVWLRALRDRVAEETGVEQAKLKAFRNNFYRSIHNLAGKSLPDGRRLVWGGPDTIYIEEQTGKMWSGYF